MLRRIVIAELLIAAAAALTAFLVHGWLAGMWFSTWIAHFGDAPANNAAFGPISEWFVRSPYVFAGIASGLVSCIGANAGSLSILRLAGPGAFSVLLLALGGSHWPLLASAYLPAWLVTFAVAMILNAIHTALCRRPDDF
jgi:hypothetical protein